MVLFILYKLFYNLFSLNPSQSHYLKAFVKAVTSFMIMDFIRDEYSFINEDDSHH